MEAVGDDAGEVEIERQALEDEEYTHIQSKDLQALYALNAVDVYTQDWSRIPSFALISHMARAPRLRSAQPCPDLHQINILPPLHHRAISARISPLRHVR